MKNRTFTSEMIARFETRTGKVAFEVWRRGSGYSYEGKYGAGSGGSLREIKHRILSDLATRRGVIATFISPEFDAA